MGAAPGAGVADRGNGGGAVDARPATFAPIGSAKAYLVTGGVALGVALIGGMTASGLDAWREQGLFAERWETVNVRLKAIEASNTANGDKLNEQSLILVRLEGTIHSIGQDAERRLRGIESDLARVDAETRGLRERQARTELEVTGLRRDVERISARMVRDDERRNGPQ